MINSKLTDNDLHYVLTRIPKDVLKIMKKENIILGGGFIRETIAGSAPNDIDLFGANKEVIRLLAEALSKDRSARIHKTDNAITIIKPPRMPVQFITKWLSNDPLEVAAGFDFTVCQAVIWFNREEKEFFSAISDEFYSDLAARRLVYTSPLREEAAGGSLLRVRKFLRRGYSIQAGSLGAVISRLMMAVRFDSLPTKRDEYEEALTGVIAGLLHEVDPLIIVDGCEGRDEHDKSYLQENENADS